MLATLKLRGKVSASRPLAAVVVGLILAACHGSGAPSTERRSRSAAVAVTGGGITADVVAVDAWSGGFSGAVRLIDTSFSSPISSFAIVFKLGSGSVTGVPWNGTITGPDASGNYTATEPSWLQNQPIQPGQTWNVGFIGGGTFTSSTIVSVTINGQPIDFSNNTDNPPVVSLAASATTVTAAGTITLTATASDDKGVTQVEFYDGTMLLGTDTTAPYTQAVALARVNNGTHTYTARAYDTFGQSTTSAPAAVTVNIASTADATPTVSLASSATTVTAASSVTLTATAADDQGVAKVEFYVGTTLLGTALEDVLNPRLKRHHLERDRSVNVAEPEGMGWLRVEPARADAPLLRVRGLTVEFDSPAGPLRAPAAAPGPPPGDRSSRH